MTPNQRAKELRDALSAFTIEEWDLAEAEVEIYRVIRSAAVRELGRLEGGALAIPRDRDVNWPLVLLAALREQADTNPWVVQRDDRAACTSPDRGGE